MDGWIERFVDATNELAEIRQTGLSGDAGAAKEEYVAAGMSHQQAFRNRRKVGSQRNGTFRRWAKLGIRSVVHHLVAGVLRDAVSGWLGWQRIALCLSSKTGADYHAMC